MQLGTREIRHWYWIKEIKGCRFHPSSFKNSSHNNPSPHLVHQIHTRDTKQKKYVKRRFLGAVMRKNGTRAQSISRRFETFLPPRTSIECQGTLNGLWNANGSRGRQRWTLVLFLFNGTVWRAMSVCLSSMAWPEQQFRMEIISRISRVVRGRLVWAWNEPCWNRCRRTSRGSTDGRCSSVRQSRISEEFQICAL